MPSARRRCTAEWNPTVSLERRLPKPQPGTTASLCVCRHPHSGLLGIQRSQWLLLGWVTKYESCTPRRRREQDPGTAGAGGHTGAATSYTAGGSVPRAATAANEQSLRNQARSDPPTRPSRSRARLCRNRTQRLGEKPAPHTHCSDTHDSWEVGATQCPPRVNGQARVAHPEWNTTQPSRGRTFRHMPQPGRTLSTLCCATVNYRTDTAWVHLHKVLAGVRCMEIESRWWVSDGAGDGVESQYVTGQSFNLGR